jgi:hypothetical protein
MSLSSCPTCGAPLPLGQTCEDLFNAAQFREIEDPAFYTVHHLSVPCYMLQHNIYSLPGWTAVRDLLRRFVEENLDPQTARREIQQAPQGSQRGWSLTRGEKHPAVAAIRWTRTVADLRLDSAEHYRADVLAWARSILQDSRDIL